MWLIDIVDASGVRRRHYLFSGTYSLGRHQSADICLCLANDPSISRNHATLHVLSVEARFIADVAHVPQLFVTDHSKHGTFLNNTRVEAHEPNQLVRPGDVIRFGLHVKALVRYSPMCVAFSKSLSSFHRRDVELLACRLGGVVSEPLDITDVHRRGIAAMGFLYVTEEVNSELSALFALLYGYVLVAPDFLALLCDVVKGAPDLPFARWPQPRHFDAMRSRALADRSYFRPEPPFFDGEEFLQTPEPRRSPTLVFRSVRFVSFADGLTSKYQQLVEAGGGRLLHVSLDRLARFLRTSAGTRSLRPLPAPNASHHEQLLPLLGIVGDPGQSHGFGTYVLLDSETFRSLMDLLEEHRVEDRKALRCSYRAMRHDALAAAFQLWRRNIPLLDEENIHAALYCNDAAAQLRHDAPGVLSRTFMGPLSEEMVADGNETEEDDECRRSCNGSDSSDVDLMRVDNSVTSRQSSPKNKKFQGIAVARDTRTQGLSLKLYPAEQLAQTHQLASGSRAATDQRRLGADGPRMSATATPSSGRLSSSRAAPASAHQPLNLRPCGSSEAPAQARVATDPRIRTTSPIRTFSPIRTRTASRVWVDGELHSLCRTFLEQSMPPLCSEVQSCCDSILSHGFVDGPAIAAIHRVDAAFRSFLDALCAAENSLLTVSLSSETRRMAYAVRQAMEVAQRAVRATYRAVGIPPPSLVSIRRAVALSPTRRPASAGVGA